MMSFNPADICTTANRGGGRGRCFDGSLPRFGIRIQHSPLFPRLNPSLTLSFFLHRQKYRIGSSVWPRGCYFNPNTVAIDLQGGLRCEGLKLELRLLLRRLNGFLRLSLDKSV